MKFISFLFISLFFIAGNSCAVLKNEQNWRLSEKKGVCTINSGQLIAPYKIKKIKNVSSKSFCSQFFKNLKLCEFAMKKYLI